METSSEYKCIIVEDEALIRRNISKKIQNLGFKVVGEAMDGESALKQIEKELPHIVITDIRMPVMDGLELVKNLYFSYPEIKVIIISGYAEFDYARQAIEYEVMEYLLKPVTAENLSSALARIKMKLDSNMSALISLADSKRDNASQEEIIKLVELYIRENYKNDLTVEDIANNLHFSADYLSRTYKKYIGQSPLKYQIKLRMNEAKRILTTDTEINIKTVAQLVGYSDQYYFSRIFKNYTGCYPSEYRTLKSPYKP